MTQSNLSHSPNGAEHSAFQSVQSALNRKPLPGPRWAWPSAAALAVVGVAYLVAGTSGGHAAHRPAPSAESAQPEASSPTTTTTTAALQPAPPHAAPGDAPAPAPANDVAASAAKGEAQGKGEAQANAEAQPNAEAQAKGDAAKASDDTGPAVASASTASKKKARRAAHRGSRKRSAPAP
jgi:hypothetical protein